MEIIPSWGADLNYLHPQFGEIEITMGPTRTVKSSVKATKTSKQSGKSGAFGGSTKGRISKKPKAPPPKQQKTKPAPGPVKKKKRIYTEKELGIPKLNMITPVGVDLPKGKKKGKVFVDDQVSPTQCLKRGSGSELTFGCMIGEHDDDTCDCKRQ